MEEEVEEDDTNDDSFKDHLKYRKQVKDPDYDFEMDEEVVENCSD